MTDSKKETGSLNGKRAEIFLQTPLFRFRYMRENEERELLENAVHVTAVIKQELSGGLWLKVEALSNLREKTSDLPFEEIFLPFNKIDFLVLS
ncbi:MAG: hypothetical protein V1798_07460 [Pseudomonadota bacterium]